MNQQNRFTMTASSATARCAIHPIIEGRQGYGCSHWKAGCQFVLWKQAYGLTVTREMASQLLQLGRTLKTYAIKMNDEVFNAQLTLNSLG